jgi:hypothetical protein
MPLNIQEYKSAVEIKVSCTKEEDEESQAV